MHEITVTETHYIVKIGSAQAACGRETTDGNRQSETRSNSDLMKKLKYSSTLHWAAGKLLSVYSVK
jgi:hypothetical protein